MASVVDASAQPARRRESISTVPEAILDFVRKRHTLKRMKGLHRLQTANAETRITEQPSAEKPAAMRSPKEYDRFAKSAAWNAGMLAGLAHYDRLMRNSATEEDRTRFKSAVGAALHKLAKNISTLAPTISLQLGHDVARQVAARTSNASENQTNVHPALLSTSHAFVVFGKLYFECIENAACRAGNLRDGEV